MNLEAEVADLLVAGFAHGASGGLFDALFFEAALFAAFGAVEALESLFDHLSTHDITIADKLGDFDRGVFVKRLARLAEEAFAGQEFVAEAAIVAAGVALLPIPEPSGRLHRGAGRSCLGQLLLILIELFGVPPVGCQSSQRQQTQQ